MLIIGVAGLRCSGKDSIAQIVSRKYGFTYLDFTKDLLAPMLTKQGKEVSRENLVSLAMKLRERGVEELARLLAEKVNGNTVISGMRFVEEGNYMKKMFGEQFTLIAVKTDDRIRYERAVKRNIKGEAKLSFAEFMEKENLPTEKVIPQLVETADFTINNNGAQKELEREVGKIMVNLKYL